MLLCYLRPVHFSRELLRWRLPDAREKMRLLSGRLWNIVLLQGLCLMSAPIFIPRVDSVCDVFCAVLGLRAGLRRARFYVPAVGVCDDALLAFHV